MTYDITVTFSVSDIRDREEAHEFGIALAEHVLDTFNDDQTIDPGIALHVKKVREKR
jgi:nitric oxide synthase oxygenase domain/subunit